MLASKIRKRYLALFGILFILGGYFMVAPNAYTADVNTINAHPAVLNKKIISKGKLKGLKISNAHIIGMVMEDVDAERAEIKNVTFANCTFTRVFMLNSHFENVAFKNCTIQNKGNPEELLNNTIFAKSVMKNVLFENTKLHNVDMTAIKGQHGYVFFRSMRDVYPPGGVGNILSGGSLHIRVMDSDIQRAYFNASNEKNASFYAKNSKFNDPLIKSDLLYVEGCTLIGGGVIGYKDMVIKDSAIDQSTIATGQNAYLLNNVYENNTKETVDPFGKPLKRVYRNPEISGDSNSHTYVLQTVKQKKPAHLNFREGSATVKNLVLYDSGWHPNFANRSIPMQELNLRNVEILNWSPWSNRHLLDGKWENVKIHGPILVKNTKIENVQTYKLTFPKGEPWEKEGDFVFNVTQSPKPFEWEEIKVPTPEEMGLEWWPMEPGYHPEK